MRSRLIATAAAIAMAGSAAAQTSHYDVTVTHRVEGFEKVQISKATIGAAPIRIWANASIEPDCRATEPAATLTVVQAPDHGSVRISDEPFYLAFPPNNPRSACNNRRIPGHQAFYRANPDFKGHDLVVLQGTSPEGHVHEISVDVEVR